jgi:hypothetical protein
MEIPQELFAYTRHFVIVLNLVTGFYSKLGQVVQGNGHQNTVSFRSIKDFNLRYALREQQFWYDYGAPMASQRALPAVYLVKRRDTFKAGDMPPFLHLLSLPKPSALRTQHPGNSPSPCPHGRDDDDHLIPNFCIMCQGPKLAMHSAPLSLGPTSSMP